MANYVLANYNFRFYLQLKAIGNNVQCTNSLACTASSVSGLDCYDGLVNFGGTSHPNISALSSSDRIIVYVNDLNGILYNVYTNRFIKTFTRANFIYKKAFAIGNSSEYDSILGYVGRNFGIRVYCYGNVLDYDTFYVIGGRADDNDNSIVSKNFCRIVYCGKNKPVSLEGDDLFSPSFDSLGNIIGLISHNVISKDTYNCQYSGSSEDGCGDIVYFTDNFSFVSFQTDRLEIDSYLDSISESLKKLNEIVVNLNPVVQISVNQNDSVDVSRPRYNFEDSNDNSFWGV